MIDREPRQLNLGLDVPVSLPPETRTALLREAGFTPKATNPDAYLNSQPPIGQVVFDAANHRTLSSIGNQIADVLDGF
jgi:hypothetical protein